MKIIDDDVPEVIDVTITSKPVMNFTYLANEAIDVTVTFTDQVDADDDTLLSLFVGDKDEATCRGARYYQGSGTQHLTFRYRVQPQDIDRNPIGGFSGEIYHRGTDVPVDYEHSGIRNAEKHQIDGRPITLSTKIISSPPEPWPAYRANQTIEVAFTYNIVVDGNPTIALGVGWNGRNHESEKREARYLRGSGTDTLIFCYTVTPGDNADEGVAIFLGLPGNGDGGDGTIKAEGTNVERSPYYLGMGNQSDHKVDTTPPSINSVTIKSSPDNGDAYDVGETISVEIQFSEQVVVSGDPYINLDVGGNDRHATMSSFESDTYADSATFQYLVQEGDYDDDGIGLFANSLYLHGGSMYDKAGIGLGFTHPATSGKVRGSNLCLRVAAGQSDERIF